MFGMGFSEIMFIAIIAIIFLGPDKLPEAMVKMARTFNSIKKSFYEVKGSIEEELNMNDLREDALSYKRNISDDISGFKNAMNQSVAGLDEVLEYENLDYSNNPKSFSKSKKKSKDAKKVPKKTKNRAKEAKKKADS